MTEALRLERALADVLWPKSGSWQVAPVDGDGDEVLTTLTLVVDADVTRYEVAMSVRSVPAKRGAVEGSRAVAGAVLEGWRAVGVGEAEVETTVAHMAAHKAGQPTPMQDRDRVISYSGPQRRTPTPPVSAKAPTPSVTAGRPAPQQPKTQATPSAPPSTRPASSMRDVASETWNANADLLPAYRQVRVKAAIDAAAAHRRPRPGRPSWGYPQATWAAVVEAAVIAVLAVPFGADLFGVGLLTVFVAVPGYWAAQRGEETFRSKQSDWEAATWHLKQEGLKTLDQLEARAAIADEARREKLRATWKYDRQSDREVPWQPDGPHPEPREGDLHWRDGEELAAAWARWLGARGVVVTQATRDGGVDVSADGVAISVKTFDKTPTVGISVVQQIAGAASGRLPVIMSTARFTAPAVTEADRIGVALLRMLPADGALIGESQLGRTTRERGLTPE